MPPGLAMRRGDANSVRALLEQMQGVDNRAPPWSAPWWRCAARGPREPLIAVGRVVARSPANPGEQWVWFDPVMWIPAFWSDLCPVAIEVRTPAATAAAPHRPWLP